MRSPLTLHYEHWTEPDSEELKFTEYVFRLLNRLKRNKKKISKIKTEKRTEKEKIKVR